MGLNNFKVILIGTGGGYGESVIVQIGKDNWIVVDSCINPITKKSLPLEYFIENKINLDNVKLIVASHWHDDHIKGINQLLCSCKKAVFGFTATAEPKKFIQFICLDCNLSTNADKPASTSMLADCLKIAKERKTAIKDITQDKVLLAIAENNINAKIYALSPSEAVFEDFSKEIGRLMAATDNSSIRIPPPKPNDHSVVLLVTVNDHNVLLGSDLEISSNPKKGWICIMQESQSVVGSTASLFKVPHHGSSTGHEPSVWDNLLQPNPIAQIAPFARGHKYLPEKKMLCEFLNRTDELYLTSYYEPQKPKKRDSSKLKTILSFNKTLKEIPLTKGIIESTIDLDSDNKSWVTTLHDKAFKVDASFLSKIKE